MMKPFVAAILCAASAVAGDIIEEKHIPQPYKFGYESQDEWGNAQSRHEQDLGDGVKTGSYGYRDALGIFRHVNYVADHAGFRAWVKTNEPGTVDSAPAAAKIEKNPEIIVKAVPTVAAPKAVIAPVAASPIAVYAVTPAAVAVSAPAPVVVSAPVSAPIITAKSRFATYAAPAPTLRIPVEFGEKLAPGPIVAAPRVAAAAAYSDGTEAASAPLTLAASSVASAPAVQPVPVRKLVGPSAATFVAPLAPVVSKLISSPKIATGPIISSGLHTASSEALVVAPALTAVPLLSVPTKKRPYEKFAETFRRRRPIKTIGDKEIYLPPTLVTSAGVPVYKDK